MKNIRSSKNLRIVETSKEDSHLRIKVKLLEDQIDMLQKSNLNIFIPLSEHQPKTTPNYQSIINKMRTQILNLQQEIQKAKIFIKKLENQKEISKINHRNQLVQLNQRLAQSHLEKQEILEENQDLHQKLESQQQLRKTVEKELIELRVEHKFLKEDFHSQKKKIEIVQNKFDQLHQCIIAVNFNSRIFKSREIKVTAIETSQLQNLKCYIEELEQKIKEMLMASRQEKVSLGVKKQNLGEEIVRLKKNIDLQLGLDVNDNSSSSFLKVYKATNDKFDQLISSCKQA